MHLWRLKEIGKKERNERINMAYELQGKVHEVFPTEQVSDRFQKREFVISFESNGYTELIKFQAVQDKCSMLDNIQEGEEVNVHFDLRGRSYTNREGKVLYFTNLQAWKIDQGGQAQQTAPAAKAQQPEDISQAPPEDDDLPF